MEVHPVDRTFRETKAVRGGPATHKIREAEAPLALVLGGQADKLGAVPRALEIRVHRHLQVGLLESLELLGDHGHTHRLAAEVLTEALQERPLGDLSAVDNVVKKTLEEKPELFG
jgi:hypothetical protein